MLRKKIIIDLFENKVEIVFRKKKISRNVEITVVVSIQTATAALGVKSNFRIVFSNKEGNDFSSERKHIV